MDFAPLDFAPLDSAPSNPVSKRFALRLDALPSPLVVVPQQLSAPLVVAAHGAGGSPEWQCDWLQRLAPSKSLLLACLRGKPMLPYEGSYYYPEHHTLGQIFTQTLDRLKVALEPRNSRLQLYVGYSQGATMGALMLHEVATVPPNLLLVEGGYEGWTVKRCRTFKLKGGRRVYFACGTDTCAKRAELIVERLNGAGIEARYGFAQGAGHTPGGQVGELAASGLAWLLSELQIP